MMTTMKIRSLTMKQPPAKPCVPAGTLYENSIAKIRKKHKEKG